MAEQLNEALDRIVPLNFTDVPTDDLTSYLQSHFEAGELICNSVPPPPGGTAFHSARPVNKEPDLAASLSDVTSSAARGPEGDYAELQKLWGKPYKFSAKENPLDLKVYKMAAHDRHGAWFAQRSVHEGVSFSKMKRAMKWEFLESLAIDGGPGAGAVRGIGVDRRLERIKAGDTTELDVWQLSAQFPGPTTAREFVAMRMSSERALSKKSAVNDTHIPRHFMVMSRPVRHIEAPERSSYILGKYESVELIREIPLHRIIKSQSTPNLNKSSDSSDRVTDKDLSSTISFPKPHSNHLKVDQDDAQLDGDSEDADLNPVEWIMISRSDPGGGIPRFMVERGTPSSIVADANKFMTWLLTKKDMPDADKEDVDVALERIRSDSSALTGRTRTTSGAGSTSDVASTTGTATSNTGTASSTGTATAVEEPTSETPHGDGYIASAKKMVEAGIEAYAPAQVAGWLATDKTKDEREDDLISDSSSSYESADEILGSKTSLPTSDDQVSTPSLADSADVAGLNPQEKEIRKLLRQEEKLKEKMAKKREDEAKKLNDIKGKTDTEQAKAKEKHDKEIQKSEEKHAKEVEKIEQKREKELARAAKKRQKQNDKDMVSKVTRERDEFKRRMELMERENKLLLEQVGDVQRENTALVHKLSKLAGSDAAMKKIKDEVDTFKKKQPSSVRSGKSGHSGHSGHGGGQHNNHGQHGGHGGQQHNNNGQHGGHGGHGGLNPANIHIHHHQQQHHVA